MTDHREYNRRYLLTHELCKNLLKNKLRAFGKDYNFTHKTIIESVLSGIPVTELIMKYPFKESIYKPVLLEEIENTRKLFFPDLAKKRYITIDAIENQLVDEPGELNIESNEFSSANLNPDVKTPTWLEVIRKSEKLTSLTQSANQRLLKAKKIFSDGNIPDVSSYNVLVPLQENQIINIYKCVLSGINKNFPVNFLAIDGKWRCKVITRYLITDFNEILDPAEIYKLDEYFFLEFKLLNALRFFNYSVNQLLLNAFPEKLNPWVIGRINDNYWEDKSNRINAIKWLVTEKLNIDVSDAGKIEINKNDFSNNGLSYLFNSHYNSVSKALSEAYPQLMPWQVSSVPLNFWTTETISQAVRWMFQKLNWDIRTLPSRYNSKQLNRKTFSKFGLSGLYENIFNCNIYKLVNTVYPKLFEKWEFGNISSAFWHSLENRQKFGAWFNKKFESNIMNPDKPYSSLETIKEFRFYNSLKKYYGKDITGFVKESMRENAEVYKSRILVRKIENLILTEKNGMLQNFLVYGIFYTMVKYQSTRFIDLLQRKRQRNLRSIP